MTHKKINLKKGKYNLGMLPRIIAFLVFVFALNAGTANAQYAAWYNNAQERIDTLRKGNFGFQIYDKDGQPYSGDVKVRLAQHEFPFGIAFDLYEDSEVMGNVYTTTNPVTAAEDAEIYQSERWNDYIAYSVPVTGSNDYKVSLKFAEVYFTEGGARIFDVHVNGELFLDDFDVFTVAGGDHIALDTSVTVSATGSKLLIELRASLDNAAIKGIVITEVGGTDTTRINCGGGALTTVDGNEYISEDGLFAPEASTIASQEDWMKAAMRKYFNYGASGNSFKWSGIQPQHTAPNYSDFDNAVEWTQSVGWELRAHTLLWGGDDDHSMPAWIRELPTPEAITDTCKMRVMREVSHYKGIIKEYDVINEPLTDHADWLRNTVGDSILWNCFKWAHEADSTAELYINDYNVEYNWGQAEEYRDLILEIQANGGPVTGVGIQAHFWDCCRPNVDELVTNLNIIAEAGLPMRLTEYDWGTDLTEEQQAADFIKVLTVAFSHPQVNGMICWGLSDNGAWRENTGFFDTLNRPKLAADTLLYYTKTKWATNFDPVLSGDAITFDAYYGDYSIEVDFGDTIKVFTVPFLKENEDSVFVLHEADAELKGPVLLTTELVEEDIILLTFDKAIEDNSVMARDFKFFSNGEIGISDIQLDPDDDHSLILTLNGATTPGDYVSVSYFPGVLKGADGSMASPFGPEGVDNPELVNYFTGNHNSSFKLYPNPAVSEINIEYTESTYKISVFNILGEEVLSEFSQDYNSRIDVSELIRGIYVIRISDSDGNVGTQKILLQ